MDRPQTCHLPYRFVNGRQRCSRCGTVLEVDQKTAQDTRFWVCRNDDEGTLDEFVAPGAALLPHQRKCDEKAWADEMGHVAGPAAGGKQSCSRCGEDLTWIFGKEPLPTGTEYTITIEHNPGEPARHSARLYIAFGTPLCS